MPDTVDDLGLAIDGGISRQANQVERRILALNGPNANHLAGISRFLLRSEAIASSRIEGISPSAQQLRRFVAGQR